MSSYSSDLNDSMTVPRAVIHKKILDEASSSPNASVEELASRVSGASEGLIERVLDEYGDPAENEVNSKKSSGGQSPGTDGDEAMSNVSEQPAFGNGIEPEEIDDQQWKILTAIQENPDATQNELADIFDVSQSTIYNRLHSIPAFDWQHRQRFVETVLEKTDRQQDEPAPTRVTGREATEQIEGLARRMERLEQRLDQQTPDDRALFDDPDLACKIIRACMNSNEISEEEEDRILKVALMAGI